MRYLPGPTSSCQVALGPAFRCSAFAGAHVRCLDQLARASSDIMECASHAGSRCSLRTCTVAPGVASLPAVLMHEPVIYGTAGGGIAEGHPPPRVAACVCRPEPALVPEAEPQGARHACAHACVLAPWQAQLAVQWCVWVHCAWAPPLPPGLPSATHRRHGRPHRFVGMHAVTTASVPGSAHSTPSGHQCTHSSNVNCGLDCGLRPLARSHSGPVQLSTPAATTLSSAAHPPHTVRHR